MPSPVIHVVAAFTRDPHGRMLLVRKEGSQIFMQPGGKPEPGEGLVEALVRELAEELQLAIDPMVLVPLGRHVARAANEPDHSLEADVFALSLPGHDVSPAAEIAEASWFTPDEAHALGERLAPLARALLERR